MKFPWQKEESEMAENKPDPNKPPEKTPAELVAESITAALAPLNTAIGKLSADVAELRKPPEKKVEPKEIPSVLDDEDGAFAARVNGPLTGVLQRQLELEARVVLADIKQEFLAEGFGPMWKQHEVEINKTITDSPLVDGGGKVLRGSPDYIRNVVYMVLGRAAAKGGVKFTDGKFFLEDASGEHSASGGKKEEGEGLSEKQKRIFQRMGVNLDDARKTVSKLEFVS